MNTIHNLLSRAYQDPAWFYAKLSYGIIFCATLIIFALPLTTALYPTGICRWVNIDSLFSAYAKPVVLTVLVSACVFYVLEIKMVFTTAVLFVIAVVIISFHESNGIFARATVLSAIIGAQFFAYALKQLNPSFNIEQYRQQFTLQIIAAGYTLAGIAKIAASGLAWFQWPAGFALQITKNYYFLYADTGNATWLSRAHAITTLFLHHPLLPQSLLLVALILELFCWLVLTKKKLLLVWGAGLLGMHVGIAYFMGIGISVIAFPMVIFFINPLLLLANLASRFSKK